MEKVVIVFTIDNKFVTPTYIALQSLFECAKEETLYECLIISDNITNKNKKILNSLVEKTRHEIRYITVHEEDVTIAKVTHVWPNVVYYRLYLCDILESYDKVIYSDVDILFRTDLSAVWGENMEDIEIAAVAAEKNDEYAIMHQYYPENKHQYIYWSGFILMNLKLMRKTGWTNRCLENLNVFRDKLKMFDLEIINLSAKKIKELPLRYVFLESLYDNEHIADAEEWAFLKRVYSEEYVRKEREQVAIIHYAGRKGKPWLRRNIPNYYFQYLKVLPTQLKWQNDIQRFRRFARLGKRHLYRYVKNIYASIVSKEGA